MNHIQLKNILDIILRIVDLLYQENLQPAYIMLASLLPQMEELVLSIEDESKQKIVIEKLQAALESMEEGDSILLADILQYELVEELENFLEE